MKKGTHHSEETRLKISQNTKMAMMLLPPLRRENFTAFQFKKGHKTWNEGIKGIHLNIKTEFKKDQFVGENSPSWKGGINVSKKDGTYIYAGKYKRIRQSRLIIKKKIGNLPRDSIVFHKNGNKFDDTIENLEVISRKELLKRNLELHKL